MEGLDSYWMLIGFLLLGVLVGIVPLVVPQLISPRYRGAKTEDTYECGMDTVGSAWIRFPVAYYVFALIFVAFEVDVLYLFPVVLVFDEPAFAIRDLVEITMFLLILSLALVYAWRKGVFRWETNQS